MRCHFLVVYSTLLLVGLKAKTRWRASAKEIKDQSHDLDCFSNTQKTHMLPAHLAVSRFLTLRKHFFFLFLTEFITITINYYYCSLKFFFFWFCFSLLYAVSGFLVFCWCAFSFLFLFHFSNFFCQEEAGAAQRTGELISSQAVSAAVPCSWAERRARTAQSDLRKETMTWVQLGLDCLVMVFFFPWNFFFTSTAWMDGLVFCINIRSFRQLNLEVGQQFS